MELNKMSKESLALKIQTLEAEKQEVSATLTNAINIANYYGSNLELIGKKMDESVFKGNPNRPVLWVISNRKAILAIIQFVIDTINEVRNKIAELKRQAEEAKNGQPQA